MRTACELCALLVGDYENDRALLNEIFRQAGWRLIGAHNRERALKVLDRSQVHVVIANSEIPGWHWRRVLEDLRRRACPPQLIVTSRTADEYLWSDVLNCGGYDVLAQPFRREEIERVIASARRHYDFPPARSETRALPASAA